MRMQFLLLMSIFPLVLFASVQASAQSTPKFDPQKYEDQAKALMEQMQKPDFDFQQFRDQMRNLMQQFQEETKDMDPDEVAKIRQQMMERMQPLIEKNMPT